MIKYEAVLKKFETLKSWNIFVVHNSHTDLGYTHRQEWVYKAHQRYIEKAIDIIEKNKDFIWTIETFWMVENFLKGTSLKYAEKFAKYVETGNIELTANYLNTTNLMDPNIVLKKATEANKFSKKFPSNVAIFQDVNSIDKGYAEALYDAGTRCVLGSIHTHHGMFAASGKQRPFIWEISKGKKLVVLNGEHYMLGNELGLHGGEINKYTFKDQIDSEFSDNIEKGLNRLYRYLKQLEEEGYEYESLLVPVSGKVIDNAPVNLKVLETIRKYQSLLPKNIKINLSRADKYFESLNREITTGKSITVEKGEWPDWWTDGVGSTPEIIRIYREAQRIYHFILKWNALNNKIPSSKINELEDAMAITSEHTWGHWSSVSHPFSNENSLLLSRKKAMADKANCLAWTILDEIREYEGENLVRIDFNDSYMVKNPYKVSRDFFVPLQIVENYQVEKSTIDRYVQLEDIYEVVDEKGNVYESCLTLNSSGVESVNTSGSWIYLVKVHLKSLESKKLTIKYKKEKDLSHTSSTRKVGVENVEDIHQKKDENCRFIQNGIENKFLQIKWHIGEGITAIIDKKTGENIVDDHPAFLPIYDVSPNASRRQMGRNRRGPNFEQTKGVLKGVKQVIDKTNVQVVDLTYELPGFVTFVQTVRITNLNNEIDVNIKLQKQLVPHPENLYIELPFEANAQTFIHRRKYSYLPWKEQISNSCLDYQTMDHGVSFKKSTKTSIAVYTPDTPLLQLGNINFESRKLMSSKVSNAEVRPMLWIMNNYWETNFAGTLEGNYLFTFTVKMGDYTELEKWLPAKEEWAISFPIY